MLKTNLKQKLALASLLAFFASSSFVIAQPPGGDDQNSQRRGPPPEAIEACANLSEGASCGFSGRNGESLQGMCFAPPKDDAKLACKPEGHSPDDADNESGQKRQGR